MPNSKRSRHCGLRESGIPEFGRIHPDQSLVDEILEIQIVEGMLTEIAIENEGRFAERYLRDRLRRGAATPINILALEKQLQILQQDPRIQSVHAALKPGAIRGESVLEVRIAENAPYRIIVEGNNYQSPSIGSERGRFTGVFDNITGFGDSLTASHSVFTGTPETSFLLTHDGRLTLDRMADLMGQTQFRDTPLELLVLSACETAAGDERAALGLAGVAIRSGARSALGSLWQINDIGAYELMVGFYEELKDPTVSKARALQLAQKRLLDSDRFAHPYFWSPYLLISNWL